MNRRTSYLCAAVAVAVAAPLAVLALTASAQTPAPAGRGAGAGRGGAADAAAPARAGNPVAPVPGAAAIFMDGEKLRAVLAEATKANPTTSTSPILLTDRYLFNMVHRGAANQPIAHANNAELHYIIEGTGVFTTGTPGNMVSRPFGPGDAILVPPSTQHGYTTLDNNNVIYLELRMPDPTLVSGAPKPAALAPFAVQASTVPDKTVAPIPLAPAVYRTAKELQDALDAATKANPAVSSTPILLTDRYNLQLVHRGTAGVPAYHDGWAELHFFIEGSGEETTGGTIVAGPNGTTQIQGGVVHAVKKGDALVIPPNVPHAATKVNGSLTYLEVRVADVTLVTGIPTPPNPPPAPARGGAPAAP